MIKNKKYIAYVKRHRDVFLEERKDADGDIIGFIWIPRLDQLKDIALRLLDKKLTLNQPGDWRYVNAAFGGWMTISEDAGKKIDDSSEEIAWAQFVVALKKRRRKK